MKLIVGLGNPGKEYSETRHNVGRSLIESIARENRAGFSKKKSLESSVASLEWGGETVAVAYPETWMNLSGNAVRKLAKHFKADPEHDLLIVVDEAALPFGILRLRSKGSDGGHNGLKSVQGLLGTQDYARLRVGVGPSEGEPIEDSLEEYVLGRFSSSEKKLLPSLFIRGKEACRLWATQSIALAMNVVNAPH